MIALSLKACSWPIFAVLLALSPLSTSGQGLSSWMDTFENMDNWIPYGDPPPQWLPTFAGRNGVFDNNGDPNYNSGAISKQQFDLSSGYRIESEVYLDFTDLGGCWAAADIGVANAQFLSWGGYDARIQFYLAACGDACWAAPSEIRRHTALSGGYDSDTGFVDLGAFLVDHLANRWVTLTIMVTPDGIPSFLADGVLIHQGNKPVSTLLRSGTSSLWLGSRSSGSAGKAYHDTVWFTSIASNAPPGILTQSTGQTNFVGETVQLRVLASGSWPISYQWRKDGLDVIGATNATLLISNVTVSTSGDYTVFVANDFGSVTSTVARVQITAVTAKNLVEGLVAYYPFTGNTDDASGNERHGVGTPLPIDDRFGYPNNAFLFNEYADHIMVPNSEDLHLHPAMSLCTWLKTSYLEPEDNYLLGKHIPGLGDGYWMAIRPGGKPSLCFITGLSAEVPVTDGRWHHVVGTWENSVASLYVDGVHCASQVQSRLPPSNAIFRIGAHTSSPWGFHGALDEVRLYDRALKGAEVKALYEFNEHKNEVLQSSYVRSELALKGTWSPPTNASVHRVVTSGTRVFALGGNSEIQMIDLSKPSSPVVLGSWRPLFQAYDIKAAGDLLYIATWEPDLLSAMEIVDFSNPAKPFLKGYYDTDGYAQDVEVIGNTAYVADAEAGLLILDVSDPAFPQRLGGFDTKGSVDRVQVSGRYAYAVNGNWVLILDVSEPWNPKRVGAYEAAGAITTIKATGGKLYLVDGNGDLWVLDVTNPARITVLGSCLGWGRGANGMAVSGDYAYLPLGARGLQVLEVADPAKVTCRTGAWNIPAEDVSLMGNYVVVAAGEKGLVIYQLEHSIYPPLRAPVINGDIMTMSWLYMDGARLQVTANLARPFWQDIPGSEVTNTVALPMTEEKAFFRLVKGPKIGQLIQPPAGIVAWWSGDADARDLVGANNGTLMRGATFGTGKVGQAFALDGVDDYVEIPDSGLWAFGISDFTIELWASFNSAREASLGDPAFIFVSNDEGYGEVRKWLFALGGSALFLHINTPSWEPRTWLVQAPFSPAIHRWYHLALTRNGTLYTVYVDGTPIGMETNLDAVPNAVAPLRIGQAEGIGYMDGLLDEISIYNRALTAAEIQAICNAGSAGKIKPPR